MDVGMKIVKDEQERKCCTMKSFSRKVYKKDCKENPYLYKVNSMTVVQMKVNLGLLLSGDHEEDCDAVMFPNVESMFSVLNNSVVEPAPAVEREKYEILLNEPCVAIWDTVKGREWCVGMSL